MTSQDWFSRLTGFTEGDYAGTQARLAVDGDELVSTVNGKRYGIGSLTLPPLAELRSGANMPDGQRSTVSCLVGDARKLHCEHEFDGALFQVASQFNLLEMVGPNITPEHGVTGYANDRTQGPACAVAAGAATIYRNYLVPVDGGIGQTHVRQLNALAGLGEALSEQSGRPVTELWDMQNGYALCSADGLAAIERLLTSSTEEQRDELRGRLAIGLHRNVEVTDMAGDSPRLVSQAYCSGLPVGYSPVPRSAWAAFAQLVLEASYEATLLAAVQQVASGGSNTVLLTRVGGGVFGNADAWIDAAIWRALRVVEHAGLDVRLVDYGSIHPSLAAIAERWESGCGSASTPGEPERRQR